MRGTAVRCLHVCLESLFHYLSITEDEGRQRHDANSVTENRPAVCLSIPPAETETATHVCEDFFFCPVFPVFACSCANVWLQMCRELTAKNLNFLESFHNNLCIFVTVEKNTFDTFTNICK